MDNGALRLVEKTNYLNKDINYLKSINISEWDMHAAGFSVLKFRKLLPEEILNEWEKLDKHTRTIKEGLLQKANPEIGKIILDTLADARKALVYANNISESQILSTKKDALFLINVDVRISKFKDVFEFRKKNEYSSYIYLNSKEFYYNSETGNLDTKGLSEESREICKNAILADIKKFLRSSEKVQPEMLFSMLKNYRNKYLNRELPADSYRELDNDGLFRVGSYALKNISPDMLQDLDISQNYLNYILPLIKSLL